MDTRDLLIDGITQLSDWLDDGLDGLSVDQVNWLPDGKTTSIGFSAWHITRTSDNIVNFVFQNRKPTIWVEQGYAEKLGLHKAEQGTGMALETARTIQINDVGLLREYNRAVKGAVVDFLKTTPMEALDEIQMIKPLGEMSKLRVVRQVMMTHGFMHLGEINLIRGILGFQFSI